MVVEGQKCTSLYAWSLQKVEVGNSPYHEHGLATALVNQILSQFRGAENSVCVVWYLKSFPLDQVVENPFTPKAVYI